MKSVLLAGRRCLARWFPGAWMVFAFAIPFALFTVYAVRSSEGVYHLEIKLTADHPVDVRVAYDPGTGFAEENAVQVGVPASPDPVAVDFPIPVDRIRALRFSPTDAPVAMRVEAVTIRTNFKIRLRHWSYHTFEPATWRTEPGDGQPPLGGEDARRLVAVEGNPAPVCTVTPRAPVRIGIAWVYLGYRWAGFALGWLLLWAGAAEAARRRDWRAAARRLSPRQAIWLVSAASVALSCYPVIFLGKSFVSTNFLGGPFLLYDDPSTLPGTFNPQLDQGRGADIFAMSNVFSPYAMVEHRALFHDGELPLWNRYDEVGVALLGQGQSMVGDPLHWLVIAANGQSWAWDVKFVLARWLFAAGVGFLVLAATDYLPAAVLLSFSAAFIGFFAYRLNHPAYFSVCYAPWILFAWIRIVRAPAWRGSMSWAGGLILANWTELNSGTVKEADMLLACLNGTGVLMLLLSRLPSKAKRRRAAGLAAAGGLFCLLASPLLLTFFGTLARASHGYENPAAFQLQPGLLVGLFDDIFYRQLVGGEGVVDPSLNGLVLLGILLAVGGSRHLLDNRIFAATALGALPPLALVFGLVPPGLIRALPFLRNIYHVDNTFSCVLLIQCLLLAGFGLKHCLTAPERCWRRDALCGLAAGGALLGAYFGTLDAQSRTNILLQPSEPVVFSPFFRWYVPAVAVAVALLPFVLRRLRQRGPEQRTVVLLVCCLVLLHWRMGTQVRSVFSPYTPVLPDRVDLLARSSAVERVQAEQPAAFRVSGTGNVFAHGYGAMAGLESLIGLDALSNPFVSTLNEAALRLTGVAATDPELPESQVPLKPFRDLFGVRYYLTMPHQALPNLPGVGLVGQLDLDVYLNRNAWPRAFFVNRLAVDEGVDDFVRRVAAGDGLPFAAVEAGELASLPAGLTGRFSADQSARTVVAASHYRLTNHRTVFDVDAPAPGVVVLTEPYVDGAFVAEVNGRRTPIWRVDHAFQGLWVDQPGTYHIVVTYWPRGFTLTLWAAALGLGLSVAAGWWLYRGGREPGRRSLVSVSDGRPSAGKYAPQGK